MLKNLQLKMKMINKSARLISRILTIVVLLFAITSFTGCKNEDKAGAAESAPINESQALYNFFIQNGDYINKPTTPAIMTAGQLYGMLDKNIHIIDLRDAEQYNQGHIEGAVNVEPANIVEYFENSIDAPYFDRVVLVCSRGQLSAYVTGIMQLLGYDNTYSVRYGMNAWNSKLAEEGWDKVTASYPDALTREPALQLKGKYGFPKISTGGRNGYEVARLRAKELLDPEHISFHVDYEEIRQSPDEYTVIAYVPADWFEMSVHPKGTVNFPPKVSLKAGGPVESITPESKIAVYCFNGHHSAHATAWLRMMGYDARSILYGANSFMHGYFEKSDKDTPREWSDALKNDFPVKSGGASQEAQETKKVAVKQAQGGC